MLLPPGAVVIDESRRVAAVKPDVDSHARGVGHDVELPVVETHPGYRSATQLQAVGQRDRTIRMEFGDAEIMVGRKGLALHW